MPRFYFGASTILNHKYITKKNKISLTFLCMNLYDYSNVLQKLTIIVKKNVVFGFDFAIAICLNSNTTKNCLHN